MQIIPENTFHRSQEAHSRREMSDKDKRLAYCNLLENYQGE